VTEVKDSPPDQVECDLFALGDVEQMRSRGNGEARGRPGIGAVMPAPMTSTGDMRAPEGQPR
jgi:hypothetical protein